MEQLYPVHKVKLNTPQGQELIERIKSQLTVDLVINSNQSMRVDIRVDKDYVFETIRHFMAAILKPGDLQAGNSKIKSLEIIPGETECDEYYTKDAYGLTLRELEIMELVSMGKSNIEVAEILKLSPETVKSHLRRIFIKYNVHKRLNAIRTYQDEKEKINDPCSSDLLFAMTKLGFLEGLN